MNERISKKTMPAKSVFHHVIRAKLFGVLTLNSLEGMLHELDALIPPDMEKDNIDSFAEEFRRFRNGMLIPTSHGDYMDRSLRSLAKDLHVPVTVELANAQIVKRVILSLARNAGEIERNEILEWLSQPNEVVIKSNRYEQLVNHTCMYFYKKPANQVSEDTLSFIRRCANELLRNKVSIDAMKRRLLSMDNGMDKDMKMDMDVGLKGFHFMTADASTNYLMNDEGTESETSDSDNILGSHMMDGSGGRKRNHGNDLMGDDGIPPKRSSM